MADELLADHTTLRLGGPAADYLTAESEADLIAAVTDADRTGTEVLLLGGGSNVVISDDGFAGRVIEVATRGIRPDTTDDVAACGGVLVSVAAGEDWDQFVARCVAEGWVGVEALSGIPGRVGSTPIQNVGAYGQDVSQTIAQVRCIERRTGQQRTFTAAECEFGYRQSRFKAAPGDYLVSEVVFQLQRGTLGAPIQYAELARTLDVQQGERAPLAEVREAVLGLRRGKGMVLDAADHDTWSAGSFFTNPIVSTPVADRLPAAAPRWPAGDLVKTSAAWLIEHAGFAKGYGLDRNPAPVSLSTKHTLALTNRGSATTADLLSLAREVRDGVAARFDIRLEPEPVMIGCAWD